MVTGWPVAGVQRRRGPCRARSLRAGGGPPLFGDDDGGGCCRAGRSRRPAGRPKATVPRPDASGSQVPATAGRSNRCGAVPRAPNCPGDRPDGGRIPGYRSPGQTGCRTRARGLRFAAQDVSCGQRHGGAAGHDAAENDHQTRGAFACGNQSGAGEPAAAGWKSAPGTTEPGRSARRAGRLGQRCVPRRGCSPGRPIRQAWRQPSGCRAGCSAGCGRSGPGRRGGDVQGAQPLLNVAVLVHAAAAALAAFEMAFEGRPAIDRKVHRPGTPPVLCPGGAIATIRGGSGDAGQFQPRLRDCLPPGSRCASFSRSMVRPRWMRERTVPSLTSKAAATSS